MPARDEALKGDGHRSLNCHNGAGKSRRLRSEKWISRNGSFVKHCFLCRMHQKCFFLEHDWLKKTTKPASRVVHFNLNHKSLLVQKFELVTFLENFPEIMVV